MTIARLGHMVFRKSDDLNVCRPSLDQAAEGGRPYVSIFQRRQHTFMNHFCAWTAWPSAKAFLTSSSISLLLMRPTTLSTTLPSRLI
jgi:hypothetical protein